MRRIVGVVAQVDLVKKIKFMIVLVLIISLFSGCAVKAPDGKKDYGVYLSAGYSGLPEDLSCSVLVIDAQYYTADEIKKLHRNNDRIYSYINIGAIENFRDYYDEFEDLTLGKYENWQDERFIDVSNESWKDLITDTIAQEFIRKGVDGFFIDNIDVYYEYHTEAIYAGITDILNKLKKTGKDIVINGGDVYVTEYLQYNGDLDDIADGVNQECVFTAINWADDTFELNTEETGEYFLNYLAKVKATGAAVYLLEYTKSDHVIDSIKEQCRSLGYIVYFSDDIALN